MPNSDVFSLQHSALNDFLFASVGLESNGTTLSLVSVFARLGNDPWREAGRLAKLPKPEAIDSLAQTLSDMPASEWTLPDARTIATRLIALLPSRSTPRVAPRVPSTRRSEMLHFFGTGVVVAGIVLGMAYALGFFTLGDPARPNGGDVAAFSSLGMPAVSHAVGN